MADEYKKIILEKAKEKYEENLKEKEKIRAELAKSN